MDDLKVDQARDQLSIFDDRVQQTPPFLVLMKLFPVRSAGYAISTAKRVINGVIVISDLVIYLENISVTQCISGFAKIWTPTT